mmetsp:Transcript_46158/g.72232  ORF Transcript_46158/g.72232 Transcript_46158/m.72232 type:complete len:83 (-) Transcript_46158:901-1149(-)
MSEVEASETGVGRRSQRPDEPGSQRDGVQVETRGYESLKGEGLNISWCEVGAFWPNLIAAANRQLGQIEDAIRGSGPTRPKN